MTKTDEIYSETLQLIIDQLEQGTVPWRQPWRNVGGPRSIDGRPYRGWNILRLHIEGMVRNYSDPRWGTFNALKRAAVKQARSEGREIIEEQVSTKNGRTKTIYFEIIDGEKKLFRGGVRAKEKGTWIILWKRAKPSRKRVAALTPDEREKADKPYMYMTMYVVFNAEQADGIAAFDPGIDLADHDPIEAAEKIADGYVDGEGGPLVDYALRDRAFYRRSDDCVRMPVLEQFKSADHFYSTLFHELAHSTGHESRLDRPKHEQRGDEKYSREELVAELGAAFLCGVAGLQTQAVTEASASYLAAWLQQQPPKTLIQAAAAAQKAADRILGVTFEQNDAQDATSEPVAAAA